MRRLISRHLNRDNQLLKHTLVIFLGSVIANFFNYLYQLLMGRMLGPAQYGVLGSLFAIIYILSVANGTVSWVVSRFVTEYSVHRDFGKVKGLVLEGLRIVTIGGVVGFGLLALASSLVAGFLHVDEPYLVAMVALYGFLTLYTPIFTGVLNGQQRFFTTSVVGATTTLLKLLIGVGLVYSGYALFGAVGALVASAACSLVLYAFVCWSVFGVPAKAVDWLDLAQYASPVFFGTVLLIVMVNVDVLLVKHFFPPVDAGFYTAASTIGKILLFGTGSLVGVMFPKVAAEEDSMKSPRGILRSTLLYTGILCCAGLAVYVAVPGLVARLMYGPAYEISGLIPLFGVAMAIYSISNVLVMYNLAVRRTGFVKMLVGVLALEIVGIGFYHASLSQVLLVLIGCQVLLGCLLAFTVRAELFPGWSRG